MSKFVIPTRNLAVHRLCFGAQSGGVVASIEASELRGVGGHRRCPVFHDGGHAASHPVVLIEIVSPSNEADTRRNVWAYTSIPSVAEILLLSSTSVVGELLRRNPQGEWAGNPLMLDADSQVELASIGFAASMRDIYATTSLAAQ